MGRFSQKSLVAFSDIPVNTDNVATSSWLISNPGQNSIYQKIKQGYYGASLWLKTVPSP
jgi:hypothetical protein